MMTLGGLFMFPWQTLLGAILPLLAGVIIGNLDKDMREFLGKAAPALIPSSPSPSVPRSISPWCGGRACWGSRWALRS